MSSCRKKMHVKSVLSVYDLTLVSSLFESRLPQPDTYTNKRVSQ